MKVIAWNYRGLGNGSAVRSLLNLQKEEDPDILFLSETKMDTRRIQGLRWRLGLTNMVVKDCNGKSGGLAIFWKSGVNFHLRSASRLYIDGDVVEKDGSVWRLTGFYGEPGQIRQSCRGRRCERLMRGGDIPGCAWATLMKFFGVMRKKGANLGRKSVWTGFGWHWRIAS
jgi:hypothetical protein